MRKDFPTPPLSALITSGAFVILFPGRLSLPSKTSILWSSFFACAPYQKSMVVFSLCYHIRYYLLDVVVSPRINSVSYRSSSWSFSNLSLIPFLCIPTFVFLYKIVFLHPCSRRYHQCSVVSHKILTTSPVSCTYPKNSFVSILPLPPYKILFPPFALTSSS